MNPGWLLFLFAFGVLIFIGLNEKYELKERQQQQTEN